MFSGYLKTVQDDRRLIRLFRMLVDWADEFQRATNTSWVQQPAGKLWLYDKFIITPLHTLVTLLTSFHKPRVKT